MFLKALYAMLLGGILTRVELFDCANVSAAHFFSEFDTSVFGNVLTLCLGSFPLQDIVD